MLCAAGLVVFAVLGLVSLKYRYLAREAFHCVFRTVQLKPCDTGFDLRMRTKVTALLLNLPRAARVWRRHHRVISTVFVLLLTTAFAYSAHTTYNLVLYGTCEPGEECEMISFPARIAAGFGGQEEAPAKKKDKQTAREDVRLVFYRKKDCPISRRVAQFLDQRIKPNYPVDVTVHTAEKKNIPDRLRKAARRQGKKPQIPSVTVGNACLQDFDRTKLMKLERPVRPLARRTARSNR